MGFIFACHLNKAGKQVSEMPVKTVKIENVQNIGQKEHQRTWKMAH
jgi:hypothetical protein